MSDGSYVLASWEDCPPDRAARPLALPWPRRLSCLPAAASPLADPGSAGLSSLGLAVPTSPRTHTHVPLPSTHTSGAGLHAPAVTRHQDLSGVRWAENLPRSCFLDGPAAQAPGEGPVGRGPGRDARLCQQTACPCPDAFPCVFTLTRLRAALGYGKRSSVHGGPRFPC